MTPANPLALLWLAAVVPVVVFYVLKVRLRRVPVSTLLFWQQVHHEHQPRALWRRLRYWVSLLAQVVMILLLAVALADPLFTWEARQSRQVVLILDNSASMNATDVSPSRLVAAKDEALRVIAGLRVRDELAVITAGGLPNVACGFSSHRGTLTTAVEEVSASDHPTRIAEAVELARRLLGDQRDEQQQEIVVLTDGGFRDDHMPDHSKLSIHRFGTNAGNVGITRFQARRSLSDPLGYEILVEVTNASDDPAECRLDIDLDDEVVDVVPLKLTPGQRWSQTLEKTSVDGGTLTAKIDRPDVLVADNQAWAVLPRREPLPVTLVTDGNLFIPKVLESNPLVELSRVAPAEWKPNSASGLTVFHRHVPEPFPRGPVLVIDPRGDGDLWRVGEPLPNPLVTRQDRDSPLMRHVRLDNVLMPEARRVQFVSDEGVKVLAAAENDPLFLSMERPGSKVLLLTVNLDEGDLPLRTAFPILMMNALAWFTEHRGELRESLPTGATTEVDAASLTSAGQAGPRDLRLIAPDGRRFPLAPSLERLILGPFDQCGVWRIVAADGDSVDAAPLLSLACQLADRDESDLRTSTKDSDSASESPSAGSWGHRPAWFWFLFAAGLLTVIEWWAYQRRLIA